MCLQMRLSLPKSRICELWSECFFPQVRRVRRSFAFCSGRNTAALSVDPLTQLIMFTARDARGNLRCTAEVEPLLYGSSCSINFAVDVEKRIVLPVLYF